MSRRSLASRRDRPPLIGVTTSEVRRAQSLQTLPESDPPRREMALGLTYLRCIEAAGGLPVVIPPFDQEVIEPLLDRFDGICLSGGPDLDPETYGAEPHPELGPIEPDLDRFELAVAARADAREMPILAICRGTQAFNVARGGTLDQHIPERSTEIAHRQKAPGEQPTHPVRIDADSKLGGILGASEIEVNSFHHQAIERLGGDLKISATAPDGTIEGIEDPRRDFLIGVQWHAETLMRRPYEDALFRRFVEACRRDAALARGRGGQEVA